MPIYEKLIKIQSELKAPKNQYNTFGKYNYRSCEDILEGVKPLLEKTKAILIIKDEIVQLGDRFYVKATVTIADTEDSSIIEVTAYAREEESKKGMDGSQVTGAASSYARKYALNGLFCIDDTKDSDATNKHDKEGSTTPKGTKQGGISEAQIKRLYAIAGKKGVTADKVKSKAQGEYKKEIKDLSKAEYDAIVSALEKLEDKK